MTLAELVEDAFFEALEQGAIPPREFEIELPRLHLRDDGSRIRIAGYTLILRCEGAADHAEWIH